MPAISTPAQSTAVRFLAPRAVINPSLSDSSFKLDFSGIAGFFGGDSAWKALATACILGSASQGTLGGVYNSPGAYEVAKRLAPLANSTLWDSIFPSDTRDATRLLGLEPTRGPTFLDASGQTARTGYPSYLLARWAMKRQRQTAETPTPESSITIVDLTPGPPEVVRRPGRLVARASISARAPTGVRKGEPTTGGPRARVSAAYSLESLHTYMQVWLTGGLALYCSLAALVLCGLARDWWCFASIMVGIFAGGFIRIALSEGNLTVACLSQEHEEAEIEPEEEAQMRSPPPSEEDGLDAQAAGGLLLPGRGAIVLVRGDPRTVNKVTRGRFRIEFPSDRSGLRLSLFMLIAQFLTQIVLIPQGTLFGQLMFVASLGTSSAYNIYLGMQQEAVQTQYLLDLFRLGGSDLSFGSTIMGSKARMAVFACLALRELPGYTPGTLLDQLITEKEEVWRRWKEAVVSKLAGNVEMVFGDDEVKTCGEGLDEGGRAELMELLKEAEEAYRMKGWRLESAGNEKADPETTTDLETIQVDVDAKDTGEK